MNDYHLRSLKENDILEKERLESEVQELVNAIVRISEDGHAMLASTGGTKKIIIDILEKYGRINTRNLIPLKVGYNLYTATRNLRD